MNSQERGFCIKRKIDKLPAAASFPVFFPMVQLRFGSGSASSYPFAEKGLFVVQKFLLGREVQLFHNGIVFHSASLLFEWGLFLFYHISG